MSNAFSIILWMGTLLCSFFLSGCDRSFEPLDAAHPDVPSKSGVTPFSGTEGEAILQGKVYKERGGPATGAAVLAFRYEDYNDTLAVAIVDTQGAFQLSGLPEGRLDVIIWCLAGFFPAKRSPVLISEGINKLKGDIILNSIDAEYDREYLIVTFKPEVSRERIQDILAEEGLTIQSKSTYDETFVLRLPAEITVLEMSERLIIRQEVKMLAPNHIGHFHF